MSILNYLFHVHVSRAHARSEPRHLSLQAPLGGPLGPDLICKAWDLTGMPGSLLQSAFHALGRLMRTVTH